MRQKMVLIAILGLIVGLAAGYYIGYDIGYERKAGPDDTPSAVTPTKKVNNFAECSSAGYPVHESYPRVCIADGKSFVEDI